MICVSDDWSQSLFYEVYPLIGEKDKEIVIIGAGDAAFDYALNLSCNNRVTILNRGSKIKALPLLFDRIQVNKAIRYLTNTEITGCIKNVLRHVEYFYKEQISGTDYCM